MNCPKCGSGTYVIDSRLKPYGVYRRRECQVCGNRFSTSEISKNLGEDQIRTLVDCSVDSFKEKIDASIDVIKSQIYESLGIKERMQNDKNESCG